MVGIDKSCQQRSYETSRRKSKPATLGIDKRTTRDDRTMSKFNTLRKVCLSYETGIKIVPGAAVRLPLAPDQAKRINPSTRGGA